MLENLPDSRLVAQRGPQLLKVLHPHEQTHQQPWSRQVSWPDYLQPKNNNNKNVFRTTVCTGRLTVAVSRLLDPQRIWIGLQVGICSGGIGRLRDKTKSDMKGGMG